MLRHVSSNSFFHLRTCHRYHLSAYPAGVSYFIKILCLLIALFKALFIPLPPGFFFFTHSIINQIVTEAGFTLNRSAITDPLYDTIAVECPLPIFVLQSSDATLGEQRQAGAQLISGIGAGAGNDTIARVFFATTISAEPEDFLWDSGTASINGLAITQ